MGQRESDSKMNAEVRKLAILRRLLVDPSSLHRLAELLGISVRTVQRDIDDWRKAGYAITKDKETNAFHLVSDYGLPPIELTFSELLTVMVALKSSGIAHEIGEGDIEKVYWKLASTLEPSFVDLISGNHENVFMLDGPKDLPDQKEPIYPILEAMKETRVLSIRYKSPARPGEIKTTLAPYSLFYAHRGWYVVGYAGLYKEIRTFKVIRILNYEVTEKKFSRPAGFSMKSFLRNAWRLFPENGPDQKIVLRFTPLVANNVAETRWHPTQENRPLPDGSLEVRFQVSGLKEILYWILGYGAEVEVLEPAELREMVADHVRRMTSYYR